MSTEVLTPGTSAPPVESLFLPIEVLVIALGKSVVVYPSNLRIPWGYEGTIVWHLVSDDTSFTFADPPLSFVDGDTAPFGQPVLDASLDTFKVPVTNTDPNPEKTGIQFRYDLQFATGGKVRRFDPTVENDPPTP